MNDLLLVWLALADFRQLQRLAHVCSWQLVRGLNRWVGGYSKPLAARASEARNTLLQRRRRRRRRRQRQGGRGTVAPSRQYKWPV